MSSLGIMRTTRVPAVVPSLTQSWLPRAPSPAVNQHRPARVRNVLGFEPIVSTYGGCVLTSATIVCADNAAANENTSHGQERACMGTPSACDPGGGRRLSVVNVNTPRQVRPQT